MTTYPLLGICRLMLGIFPASMSSFIISIVILVFVVGIVGGVVVRSYQVIKSLLDFFFKDFFNRHLIFRKLNSRSRAFLGRNFKFYQRLNGRDKLLFERRVQKFMNMKEFEPRGELKEVTVEMQTLIAASAIQITFGLPSVYFSHFDRILVYPDNYYSDITQHHHQGEVNTKGIIVLSWKNLLQGYAIENDGRNLGLHEMAHALKIADAMSGDEHDTMDYDAYHAFIREARLEMQKIADGHESFFRSYAATNDYEFFAVAVENFFERPLEFRDYHEKLFRLMTELLNQDPLVYNAAVMQPDTHF